MKKLFFSFILLTGFAIASNAQSNNDAAGTGTQVQTIEQPASEGADASAESPAKVNDSHKHKSCCASKNASADAGDKNANATASGKKKSCCADGKKTSANCHEMKKEEKTYHYLPWKK